MRKAISTVVVACAFVAGASGVATAARVHVSTTRCGNKYTPACTKPKIKNKPLSAKCVSAGSRYTLPDITFTSNAGLRRIQVREGSKTLRTISFTGKGPTQFALKGLAVSTVGLNSGGHQLSVKVTDVKGKSASKALRFSVCVSTPVFTG